MIRSNQFFYGKFWSKQRGASNLQNEKQTCIQQESRAQATKCYKYYSMSQISQAIKYRIKMKHNIGFN